MQWANAFGGLGLFLIGMLLTTEGLKAFAGDSLRKMLLRSTGTPLKAVGTGALTTALVQSSSATTVATLGFVGAGLVTFEQAFGIVLGANLGTTATGWIVAGIGLKFSVSSVAMPLVGVGALARLFAKGRFQHLGMALAGFGMIFVGIDVMQGGMESIAATLVDRMNMGGGWAGRLGMLLVGVATTALTQSSSAAMAVTLTAMHGGVLPMDQASAMVIGVNIGTTVTAALAAVGATTDTKRIALGHVLFNIVTGIVAFFLLPAFLWLLSQFEGMVGGDAALLLAGFHTLFNLLGVALFLPLIPRMRDLTHRWVKPAGAKLTRHLERNASALGVVGMEAVRKCAREIALELFSIAQDIMERSKVTGPSEARLHAVDEALTEVGRYTDTLQGLSGAGHGSLRRHVATVHALERLQAFASTLTAGASLFGELGDELSQETDQLRTMLAEEAEWLGRGDPKPSPDWLRSRHQELAARRKDLRERTLVRIAEGRIAPDEGAKTIEAVRRIDQLGFYAYRAGYRLSEAGVEATELLGDR